MFVQSGRPSAYGPLALSSLALSSLALSTLALSTLALSALALAILACGAGDGSTTDGRPSLQLFAAASLQDVAHDLADAFQDRESVEVVLNTAGSNVLAQQIAATHRADLLISADRQWVDFLADRGRIVDGTQRDILANSLVVVARPDSPHQLRRLADLATLPLRHLAVADPEAVPAGRYVRAHLQTIPWPRSDSDQTLWQAVAGRLVPTADVRAALALSASDPDILAVVYRTDALQSSEVDILLHLPKIPEVVIAYRAAVVEGGKQEALARRFLAFLDTPAGREIIRRHGFDSL